MNPLISVIIPVYNVEKYLTYCLDSVINQSYRNLEIIIVDDGSTDGSGIICDKYGAFDNRIRIIHKENGGLSDARNKGLEFAKGEYLAFIDSDDVIHPDFFSVLMNNALKYNADIISADMLYFYDHTELEELRQRSIDYTIQCLDKEKAIIEYLMPSRRDPYIYHGLCMKIYRKVVFQDLVFEKGRLHEDLFITYKLLDKCKIFVYLNAKIYFYFQNNRGSICNNYKIKNFCDESDATFEMIDYFRNRKDLSKALHYCAAARFLNMLYKSRNFSLSTEYMEKKNKITKWIKKNIWSAGRMKLIKKIIVFLSAYDIKYYLMLLKIRGVHE